MDNKDFSDSSKGKASKHVIVNNSLHSLDPEEVDQLLEEEKPEDEEENVTKQFSKFEIPIAEELANYFKVRFDPKKILKKQNFSINFKTG